MALISYKLVQDITNALTNAQTGRVQMGEQQLK